MAAPFSIETSYPAATDVQSAFPAHETAFRTTVNDWLSSFSDPATGDLLLTALAPLLAEANTWTAAQTFDDVTVGGALGVTGASTLHALTAGATTLSSLALTTALPLSEGGTGATSATAARTALGLGTLATLNSVNLGSNVTGTLPLANGGTGATTAAAARTALGLGTAATTASTAYATAAQGTLATNAMPKTGGTFTGAINSGTDGDNNGGIVMAKRSSGFSEVISYSDGAGGVRGLIGMTSTGTMGFRIGDGTTDDIIFGSTGTITASGDITYSSDIALKDNIVPIEGALDRVRKLGGYLYDRIDLGTHSAGLIAQEVEQVLPEAVHTDEKGMKAIAAGPLIGLLVQAIKELASK